MAEEPEHALLSTALTAVHGALLYRVILHQSVQIQLNYAKIVQPAVAIFRPLLLTHGMSLPILQCQHNLPMQVAARISAVLFLPMHQVEQVLSAISGRYQQTVVHQAGPMFQQAELLHRTLFQQQLPEPIIFVVQ